jgi:hypothetical protein
MRKGDVHVNREAIQSRSTGTCKAKPTHTKSPPPFWLSGDRMYLRRD